MLLMIDNYDSFTFNVVQYLGELGAEVHVVRNDELTVSDIESLKPERIVISTIKAFAGRLPILGICLGHQSIGQVFGGDVVRARAVMHGKTSSIYHSGKGVFHNLPSPYIATRYHSLVVDKATLPDCLEVTAWTQTAEGNVDEIMGFRHKTFAIEGVQFHPESILTEHGHALLENFLKTEERA
jgi:anthranilate synthase component 2